MEALKLPSARVYDSNSPFQQKIQTMLSPALICSILVGWMKQLSEIEKYVVDAEYFFHSSQFFT